MVKTPSFCIVIELKKTIIIYKYELSDFVILAFLTPNLSNDVTLTSLGIDHRCFDTLGKLQVYCIFIKIRYNKIDSSKVSKQHFQMYYC
jgi:hypothetical protein